MRHGEPGVFANNALWTYGRDIVSGAKTAPDSGVTPSILWGRDSAFGFSITLGMDKIRLHFIHA
jgi:hypothetical protein